MKRVRSISKNWLVSAALAVLMTVSFIGSVSAQKKAAAGLMVVTIVHIKPDMRAEFQKFIKDEYKAALIKGGEKQMWTWQTAAFGDPFKYIFVSSVSKMGDLDSPGAMEKGVGHANMGTFFKRAGSFVTSVHQYLMVERTDLSYVGPAMSVPKMAVFATIRSGASQIDFDTYMLNEMLPAYKKSEAKAMLVHQTAFGGDPHEYVVIVPIENFADIDKGHPVARSIGIEAWIKMKDKMPGTITDVSVMRLNTDLSIMGETPAKKE